MIAKQMLESKSRKFRCVVGNKQINFLDMLYQFDISDWLRFACSIISLKLSNEEIDPSCCEGYNEVDGCSMTAGERTEGT